MRTIPSLGNEDGTDPTSTNEQAVNGGVPPTHHPPDTLSTGLWLSRLEHRPYKPTVAGSSPASPTNPHTPKRNTTISSRIPNASRISPRYPHENHPHRNPKIAYTQKPPKICPTTRSSLQTINLSSKQSNALLHPSTRRYRIPTPPPTIVCALNTQIPPR